jgi:hypothetical protein
MWQRLEDGERKVDLEEIASIASILGVTVSHLFGEQPVMLPHYKKRGRRPGTALVGDAGGLGK